MYRILSSKRFQRFVAGIILPVFLFVGVLGTPMSALAQTVHQSQLAQATVAASVRTGSVVQLSQAAGGKAGAIVAGAKVVGLTALGTFLGGLGSDAAGLLIFYWIFSTIVEIFSKIVNELLVWSLRTFILLTGYNDFLNNEFVNSGWATLRDIANLFFVVILLVIAFATVLNISSYEYQQLLPRFILAIFLVNFSRTIVGLMIDASQVVMVTFASAFYQSAAGNFIRLLRIDQWLQVKSIVGTAITSAGGATAGETLTAIGSAIGAVDIVSNFVALLFTMAVATFALGVGLTLVAVIVYRIVALWLLIIFSPLAFLAWVLPSTRSYFSQWFGVLVKQLTVGPLLVFVVWLALSTVQQNPQSYALIENSQSITQIMSSLGMTNGYAELDGSSALSAGLSQSVGDNQIASTAISSWNNLTAFVVAITVLIAGIKFASGMSGGAGAFAEKLAGYARKPFDFGEQKAKALGKWGAKVGLSEPTKESAWYLRSKKEAKLVPGVGRFFKSSEERVKDSELYNMKWYAKNQGIAALGKGRVGMNQGETSYKEKLNEKKYQDAQEIFDDTESRFRDKYGAINPATGQFQIKGPTIKAKGGDSIQVTGDAMELRARRDLFKEMKEKEINKSMVVDEEKGITKDNVAKMRKEALTDAMNSFDKTFDVREHNPDEGAVDGSVPNARKISGHLVPGTVPPNPQAGANSRKMPPANQNPQGGGGVTVRAMPGSGSPMPQPPSPISAGSPLAASSTPDVDDTSASSVSPAQPQAQPTVAGGTAAAPVNVAQNNQSSTTVNVNASVNAPVVGAPAAGAGSARRPTRLSAANSPAGVSLSEAKAAADAKQRDAQDAKAATRAASARARKEDSARVNAAPAVPPVSTGTPSVRRDSGATGQKAAEAARAKSEAANAAGPNIVVEAAQNAQMSREVEERLRSLEAAESAQGTVSENRQKQIDELAKQLGDLSNGKPKVVRQMIQSNPDIRKIVAGIVKDPIAARQLQKRIEGEIKKNPSLKSLSEEDAREISKEQTKVAMRALKKEDRESLEKNSSKPELREVAREVLDEPDDEVVESGTSVPPTDTDTTPNA